MKVYLKVMLHVAEQRWLDNYGCEQPVADDVVNYFTHEVIAGSYPATSQLVKIENTYVEQPRRGRAVAAPQGMTPVLMLVEMNVSRQAWAQEFGLHDTAAAVAEDVAAYFEHNVLEGCAPVANELITVQDVATVRRPRQVARAAT